MHWGVRRKRGADGRVTGPSHPPSHDAARASEHLTRARTHGTSALSNQELQHLVNRMNLESQYSRLSSQTKKQNAGAKFARDLLVNTGKTQAQNIANDAAKKAIARALAKKAARTAVKVGVAAAL